MITLLVCASVMCIADTPAFSINTSHESTGPNDVTARSNMLLLSKVSTHTTICISSRGLSRIVLNIIDRGGRQVVLIRNWKEFQRLMFTNLLLISQTSLGIDFDISSKSCNGHQRDLSISTSWGIALHFCNKKGAP
jgi:hypothetical protein